jgi:hypothetical protein
LRCACRAARAIRAQLKVKEILDGLCLHNELGWVDSAHAPDDIKIQELMVYDFKKLLEQGRTNELLFAVGTTAWSSDRRNSSPAQIVHTVYTFRFAS